MLTYHRRPLACALVALFALTLPAPAADINKYLPDDADLVMVINVKQLMQAPIVQKYAPQLLKKAAEGDDHLKKALTGLGFDPLKDLTSVTVASSGIGPDGKGTIIFEGTFDTAKFEAVAEAAGKDSPVKVLKEGEHKIFEIKYASEPKPAYAGILDKNTIVLATEKSQVLESFDRAAGKKTGKLKKELAALIEKANAAQSLWMVAPATVLTQAPIPLDGDAAKTLAKIDNLNIGFTLTAEFKLAIAVVTKSADAAKEVKEQLNTGIEMIKGIVNQIASTEKKLSVVVDIIGAMRVANDGNVITLKSELSPEMIEKLEKIIKSDSN
jgi:hypothetical protein